MNGDRFTKGIIISSLKFLTAGISKYGSKNSYFTQELGLKHFQNNSISLIEIAHSILLKSVLAALK